MFPTDSHIVVGVAVGMHAAVPAANSMRNDYLLIMTVLAVCELVVSGAVQSWGAQCHIYTHMARRSLCLLH
jgi:hypothetical protein